MKPRRAAEDQDTEVGAFADRAESREQKLLVCELIRFTVFCCRQSPGDIELLLISSIVLSPRSENS